MLITFLDIKGVVHSEFIPQGQRVNLAYYIETVKRLLEAVRRKTPELWLKDCILHHGSAPADMALFVKQFLAQKLITRMEQPAYSPDSSPSDLWLFPKLSVL